MSTTRVCTGAPSPSRAALTSTPLSMSMVHVNRPPRLCLRTYSPLAYTERGVSTDRNRPLSGLYR
ncbi:hypothetical protein D3C72_1019390 [compost metagenome]